MNFELLVSPGCPNAEAAHALFERALALETPDPVTIRLREIANTDQAAVLAFHGSPTFAAGGRDLFPAAGKPAIACRVYRSGLKMTGLPEIADLRAAIRAALSRERSTAD